MDNPLRDSSALRDSAGGVASRAALVVGDRVTVDGLRSRLAQQGAPTAVVVVEHGRPRTLDALHVIRTTSPGDQRPATTLHCCEPSSLSASAMLPTMLTAALARPEGHERHDLAVTTNEGYGLVSVDQLMRSLDTRSAMRPRHDALTGLPDRSLITEILASQLERHPGEIAVAFVDLDRFKEVNDRLGHAIGDRVLATIAQRLSGGLRSSDVIGRIGGDEFVAVMHVQGPAEARLAAERMVKRVDEPVEQGPASVSIGISVGVTLSNEDRVDAARMIADADALMYLAKQRGGGVVVAGDLADAVVTRSQLGSALSTHQLALHYQPIVPLDGSPYGSLEALVRWPQADGSLLSPAAFIPLAEATGQVVDLDWWALQTAIDQLQTWGRDQSAPHDLHVNLSARTLAVPGLVSHVERLLAMADVAPSRLTLEVTETAVIADIQRASAVLSAMRDLGVRTAIDDFGVGQSSLSQLSRLPVSSLKIDRAFVEQLADRDVDRGVVGLVQAMAAELGLDVIAEGVESTHQADMLRELGVTHAQGWLWSAALRATEVVHDAPVRTG